MYCGIINVADTWWKVSYRALQYFHNCNIMCRLLLLLLIHMVFFCSLRLVPKFLASTLVMAYCAIFRTNYARTLEVTQKTASWLLNKGMKDDKITVTETTCESALKQFSYLARRPVDGIGRGPHSVVSTALRHFKLSTCSAWGTWYASVYLVVWIQLYGYIM